MVTPPESMPGTSESMALRISESMVGQDRRAGISISMAGSSGL